MIQNAGDYYSNQPPVPIKNKHIEYREAWSDKHLDWIGGFANAQGGTMYIGKKSNGMVAGLPNAEKLLADIPKKVRHILGITVEVNLNTQRRRDFLQILTEPHPHPVICQGRYHFYSKGTNRELKGEELNKFLLRKKGRKWDSVAVPNVSVANLSQSSIFDYKKRAIHSQRNSNDLLSLGDEDLMKSLHLNEDAYLKRAAILLFHPEPEKYMAGAYIKVGYFQSDSGLDHQAEIRGSLFQQITKSLALLHTKHSAASASDIDNDRFLTFDIPEVAVREVLLNAVIHKDYGSGTPIQISIYPDKFTISNAGRLPKNLPIEDLEKKHHSFPANPDIANVLFQAGYIGSWGRGTLDIVETCHKAGIPKPQFYVNQSEFRIEFQNLQAGKNERKDVVEPYRKNDGVNDGVKSSPSRKKKTSTKDANLTSKTEGVNEGVNFIKNDENIIYSKTAKPTIKIRGLRKNSIDEISKNEGTNDGVNKPIIGSKKTNRETTVKKTKNEGANDRAKPKKSNTIKGSKITSLIDDLYTDTLSNTVKQRLVKVIKMLLKKPGMNATLICQRIDRSIPTIERYLQSLKQSGLIEFRGAPKTGGYYLTKKAMDVLGH